MPEPAAERRGAQGGRREKRDRRLREPSSANGRERVLDRGELGRELVRARAPPGRILLEQPEDRRLQAFRRRGVVPRPRRLVQDRVRDRDGRAALERHPARHHLVHHDAEREEVAARVDGLAEQLLRRHVRQRSESHPFARQLRLRSLGGGSGRQTLGEPEVEDLHFVSRRQNDVAALDVAVEDPRSVRLFQRRGDLPGDRDHLERRQRTLGEDRVERASLHELHYDEMPPGHFHEVIDRADVGMVQGGRGHRLAPEPLPPLDVPSELLGQQLDRHHPLEARVPSPIDLAESPRAEELEHLEVIDGGSELDGGRPGLREPVPDKGMAAVSSPDSAELSVRPLAPPGFTESSPWGSSVWILGHQGLRMAGTILCCGKRSAGDGSGGEDGI